LARIEALLRRTRLAETRPYRFGDVEVDAGQRTVTRAGAEVSVTPMEFDLLLALLKREGAVVSRLDLLQEVWGHSAAVLTRTVDTHIAELRRKLERDPAAPAHILTSRKAGYRLAGLAK
jgi:DNA-binding response OmpR family regulator